MGTKKQELESGCLAKADDDTIIFVLKSCDMLAPATIRFWATEYIRAGGKNMAKHKAALDTAFRMEQQALQWGGSKLPD